MKSVSSKTVNRMIFLDYNLVLQSITNFLLSIEKIKLTLNQPSLSNSINIFIKVDLVGIDVLWRRHKINYHNGDFGHITFVLINLPPYHLLLVQYMDRNRLPV